MNSKLFAPPLQPGTAFYPYAVRDRAPRLKTPSDTQRIRWVAFWPLVALALISGMLTVVRASLPPTHDVSTVVQRQVDAYNARDLAAFLDAYSEDVMVYRMPAAQPTLSGKRAMGEFYQSQRFNIPTLHAKILSRMVAGNKVVDHELIHGIAKDDIAAIVVYEIHDDRISKVWIYSVD